MQRLVHDIDRASTIETSTIDVGLEQAHYIIDQNTNRVCVVK